MAEIVNFPNGQDLEAIKKETAVQNAAAEDAVEQLLEKCPVMKETLAGVSDEEFAAAFKETFDAERTESCDVCDEMPAEAMAAMHASAKNDDAEDSVPNETEEEKEPSLYERDLKDIEAFIKVPFVDLITQAKTIKSSISDLESAKEMMDQIGMKGDPMGIAQGNFLDKATTFTGKSPDEFYEQYPKLVEEANRLNAMLEKLLKMYGEVTHSTCFMSNSMVESATAKAEAIEARGLKANEAWMMKRNRKTIEAFQDRTNFAPLFTKLEYPQNTIETFKKFMDIGPEKAMAYVDKFFTDIFGDSLAKNFRQVLHTILRGDVEATDENRVDDLFFSYWLATIYYREEKTGKHSFVKTLIMNVYDINSGIYDLTGGSELIKSTLQVMNLLIRMSLSETGSMKNIVKNYRPKYAQVMMSFNSMRKQILDTSDNPAFNGSRLVDINPNVNPEEIAAMLEDERNTAAELAAAEAEENRQDSEEVEDDTASEDDEVEDSDESDDDESEDTDGEPTPPTVAN